MSRLNTATDLIKPEVDGVYFGEELISGQTFLPHPGQQALKDTIVGTGKQLRLSIGEQRYSSRAAKCSTMKTYGRWLLKQVIDLSHQDGGFLRQGIRNGVMLSAGSRKYSATSVRKYICASLLSRAASSQDSVCAASSSTKRPCAPWYREDNYCQ